jgi:hypothetical protein
MQSPRHVKIEWRLDCVNDSQLEGSPSRVPSLIMEVVHLFHKYTQCLTHSRQKTSRKAVYSMILRFYYAQAGCCVGAKGPQDHHCVEQFTRGSQN